MRNKVAKEIRKFLKQDQGLDLSHKACEDRGFRGVQIGEITVRKAFELEEETLPIMRFSNPEKNFYRQIKKKYVKGGI